jgi:hypothetical protein
MKSNEGTFAAVATTGGRLYIYYRPGWLKVDNKGTQARGALLSPKLDLSTLILPSLSATALCCAAFDLCLHHLVVRSSMGGSFEVKVDDTI